MLAQTQRRAMCQNLSKFKAPKTFDLALLLLGISTSCVENIMCRDVCDSIICDSRDILEQPKCPLIQGWLDLWFIQIIE